MNQGKAITNRESLTRNKSADAGRFKVLSCKILTALTALFFFAGMEGLAATGSKQSPDPREILSQNPSSGKLLQVPFIAQDRFQCGPASVAMVLRWHGKPADPEKIAARFESEAVAGTFTVDLLIAAVEAGMEAHWVEGSLPALKKEIDQNRPVIVFLNLAPNPLPRRHFAVAAGYLEWKGKDYIVLHTGRTPFAMIPEKKFLRQWKRTGKMMMTMKPESSPEDEAEKSREAPTKTGGEP